MKRLMYCSVVMALIGLAGTQPLEAQRKGMGGVIDWINELSGPSMIGPAVSYYWYFEDSSPEESPAEESRGEASPGEATFGQASLVPPNRITVWLAYQWSGTSDDAISEPGKGITMWSLEITYERVVFARGFEVAAGVGIAAHLFDGDDRVAAFVNYSLLLPYVQARVPLGKGVQLVGGVGYHYFLEFDEGDFAPLTVDVSRDGGELTPWLSFGVEIDW